MKGDYVFWEEVSLILTTIVSATGVGQKVLIVSSLLGTYFFLLRNPAFRDSLSELFLVWKEVPFFSRGPLLGFTLIAGGVDVSGDVPPKK